jgi:hypothetical protein
MIGYEELGYMLPPPEKIWPDKGKGIRCGTCQFLTKQGDIEDLGGCALMSESKQKVHVQACCNFYHNAADTKNLVFPDFPGSDKVKALLGLKKQKSQAPAVADSSK